MQLLRKGQGTNVVKSKVVAKKWLHAIMLSPIIFNDEGVTIALASLQPFIGHHF